MVGANALVNDFGSCAPTLRFRAATGCVVGHAEMTGSSRTIKWINQTAKLKDFINIGKSKPANRMLADKHKEKLQ